MPQDEIYLPVHVGCALQMQAAQGFDARFVDDNTGQNISNLNTYYSELTAMYWMWKNCIANYKGLVHYRRHFKTKQPAHARAHERIDRAATAADFSQLFGEGYTVILPKKRNYYIETVRSHWNHTMPEEQLEVAEVVVRETQPKYYAELEKHLEKTTAHLFNMCVMRSDIFGEYCTWLFAVLEECTQRLSPNNYDAFLARYPGRISEILMDAWVSTNNIKYAELPTVSPEKVNWPKKATSFLSAKFLSKKYTESF
jgi:hypothetical protein